MAYKLPFNSFGQICGYNKKVATCRLVCGNAKSGNWLPGAESPAWLDGSIPGDFGFDPLGLGKDPKRLSRFTEGELINGRWAMLGVVGCIAVELLGQGNWADAPLWAVKGNNPTYLGVEIPMAGDVALLTVVEILLMGAVETLRGSEKDPEKRKYPGGAFDPLGFAKNENQVETLKLKEIKNGRLAMLAMLGFFCQHSVYKRGPLEDLKEHLSNPMVYNVGGATNHTSVPAAAFGLPDFN